MKTIKLLIILAFLPVMLIGQIGQWDSTEAIIYPTDTTGKIVLDAGDTLYLINVDTTDANASINYINRLSLTEMIYDFDDDASDDTIPACILFQNYDFDSVFYSRINKNRITEIEVYSTATDRMNYFNVPFSLTTTMHTVCASGCDDVSIVDAATNAGSTDTIFIFSGKYFDGEVTVNKPLTIIGGGNVECNGLTSYAFDVSTSALVTINNIYINSNTQYSVRLRGSGGHQLNNCYVDGTTKSIITTNALNYNFYVNNSVIKGACYIQDDYDFNNCYFSNNAYINSGWNDTIRVNNSFFKESTTTSYRFNSKTFLYSSNNKYYCPIGPNASTADDTRYQASFIKDSLYKNNEASFFSFSKGGKLFIDSCYFDQLNNSETSLLGIQNMDTVSITNSYFNDIHNQISFLATDTAFFVNYENNTLISDTNNPAIFNYTSVKGHIFNSIFEGDSGFIINITNPNLTDSLAVIIEKNEFRYKDGDGIAINIGSILDRQYLNKTKFTKNIYYGEDYYGNGAFTHAILAGLMDDFEISYNTFIGCFLTNVLKTTDEGGYNNNNVILNNKYIDCHTGVLLRSVNGVKVYNNIFRSDTITDRANIQLSTYETGTGKYCDSIFIFNNICYNDQYPCIYIDSTGHLTKLYSNNNILYSNIDAARIQSTYYDLSEWQGLGFDSNSYNSDPLLNSNKEPSSNSPAINNGTDLGQDFNIKIAYGSIWPNGIIFTTITDGQPDIGPFEYKPTSTGYLINLNDNSYSIDYNSNDYILNLSR